MHFSYTYKNTVLYRSYMCRSHAFSVRYEMVCITETVFSVRYEMWLVCIMECSLSGTRCDRSDRGDGVLCQVRDGLCHGDSVLCQVRNVIDLYHGDGVPVRYEMICVMVAVFSVRYEMWLICIMETVFSVRYEMRSNRQVTIQTEQGFMIDSELCYFDTMKTSGAKQERRRHSAAICGHFLLC
jgi:hypothetical protein